MYFDSTGRSVLQQAGAAFLLVVTPVVLAGCGSDPALPNLVGLPLDQAKTTAESAGFADVVSRDVLKKRSQIVDGNWQVCTQGPDPGPTDTDTTIDVGVVRTEESCPGVATTALPTKTTTSTTTPVPTTTPLAGVDVNGDLDDDLDRPRTGAPYVPAPNLSDEGSGSSGGSAYYRNCTAAKAAGAAPLLRGEPGYRPELDRNNDGVACE